MILARNISAGRILPTQTYSSKCVRSLTQREVPTLYGDEVSPPVRFTMMTADQLGYALNFNTVDLFKGENKSEAFAKINPLRKIPVLDTGKEIICDSHAIALYLCRQAPNNALYPEDTSLQAQVDQLLFFNAGSLFPADSAVFSDFFSGKTIDDSKVEHWNTLLDFLNKKLENHPWLAGDKMMLCDLCCGATISSFGLLVPLSNRHNKVAEWMKNLQELPCFQINSRGLKRLGDFLRTLRKM